MIKRKLKAWYFRNFKYRNKSASIVFASYKPTLFEVLQTSGGIQMVYIGRNKYIEVKRHKP